MPDAKEKKNFRTSIPAVGMNDPDNFELPEGHPVQYPQMMVYHEHVDPDDKEAGFTNHPYMHTDGKPIIVQDEEEHNAFLDHLIKNPKKQKGTHTPGLEERKKASGVRGADEDDSKKKRK